MRVGLVIPGSLVRIGAERERERVVDLIRDLAHEVHNTGLVRDHRDRTVIGLEIGDIRTCENHLCVDALATIRDINGVTEDLPKVN